MQETDASQMLTSQKETLFQPPSTENFTPTSDKHMVNCWLAAWSAQSSLAPAEQSACFKLLVFLISPSFLFPDLHHLRILALSGKSAVGKCTFVWNGRVGTLGKVDTDEKSKRCTIKACRCSPLAALSILDAEVQRLIVLNVRPWSSLLLWENNTELLGEARILPCSASHWFPSLGSDLWVGPVFAPRWAVQTH